MNVRMPDRSEFTIHDRTGILQKIKRYTRPFLFNLNLNLAHNSLSPISKVTMIKSIPNNTNQFNNDENISQ